MPRLRWLTAGESHGPGLTVLLDGVPAGLPLLAEDIDADLAERQKGYGRGGRMKIETDRVAFQGGVRLGRTLGSTVALHIENKDFANWKERMSPAPVAAVIEASTKPRQGMRILPAASSTTHTTYATSSNARVLARRPRVSPQEP